MRQPADPMAPIVFSRELLAFLAKNADPHPHIMTLALLQVNNRTYHF